MLMNLSIFDIGQVSLEVIMSTNSGHTHRIFLAEHLRYLLIKIGGQCSCYTIYIYILLLYTAKLLLDLFVWKCDFSAWIKAEGCIQMPIILNRCSLLSNSKHTYARITCDVEVMVQLIGACRVGGYAAIHSRHRGGDHSQDPHSLRRTQHWAQNLQKHSLP